MDRLEIFYRDDFDSPEGKRGRRGFRKYIAGQTLGEAWLGAA